MIEFNVGKALKIFLNEQNRSLIQSIFFLQIVSTNSATNSFTTKLIAKNWIQLGVHILDVRDVAN